MPPVHERRSGRLSGPPRAGVPLPGAGGYAYPRGPYGATGFPGSTPASPRTKDEGPAGRKDPSYRGNPTRTITGQHADWTGPDFDVGQWEVPKPQPSYGQVRLRPGAGFPSRFIRANGTPRQPTARQMRSTSDEQRMTPVIGGAPGSQNVRNRIAQRYKAVPGQLHTYKPSANPGKTGAQIGGPARYHPGTAIPGHPDGKPVPGMLANDLAPATPYTVTVPSRYVSLEGSQEGYAVNRPLRFAHGGRPPTWPQGFIDARGDATPTPSHLRGGRLSGQRYFGAIADQQRIGLESDAYGIARARGPRHRPVRFEAPSPWAVNYYDVPSDQGTAAPDMIHRSPGRPRTRHTRVRRG